MTYVEESFFLCVCVCVLFFVFVFLLLTDYHHNNVIKGEKESSPKIETQKPKWRTILHSGLNKNISTGTHQLS